MGEEESKGCPRLQSLPSVSRSDATRNLIMGEKSAKVEWMCNHKKVLVLVLQFHTTRFP
jgi:hypothetical protein